MNAATSAVRMLGCFGVLVCGFIGLFVWWPMLVVGILPLALCFLSDPKNIEAPKEVHIHHYHDSYDGKTAPASAPTPVRPQGKTAKQVEDGIDWDKF